MVAAICTPAAAMTHRATCKGVSLRLGAENHRWQPTVHPPKKVVRFVPVVRSEARPAFSRVQQPEGGLPQWLQTAAKGAAIVSIAAALLLTSAAPAEAGRSGGRVGGRVSRSAPSSSYSGSMGSSYSRSYGRTTIVAPSFTAPSPYYGAPMVGGGYSMFFFPTYGYPVGGGFFSFLFTLLAVVAIFQVVRSFMGADEGLEIGGERVAVGKLQVALLGSARQLQQDLDRIAARADTSTTEGLHYVLQETVLALQRNPDYWVYGASELQFERGYDEAEAVFNEISLGERSKFRQETLSNFAGDTRQKSMTMSAGADGTAELIVVTILVAADVALKLPKINGRDDLRTALNRIGSVPEQSIVAVEVLWTPQDPNDYLTRDEIIADYPTLAIL